jgi:hypothetical protein
VRWFLILLLSASTAHADTRLSVHAAGGLEAGFVEGKPSPGAMGEIGVGLDLLGPRWGVGLVVERVGRNHSELEIATEYKLDALVRIRNPRNGFVGGFGAGVRRIEIPGEDLRPGSTLWGIDFMRANIEYPIVRMGRGSIYFAWTFGYYTGDIYTDRIGDMAFPTRDYATLSNTYVLGVQASFVTQD